jgi:hypothetical protein
MLERGSTIGMRLHVYLDSADLGDRMITVVQNRAAAKA